MSAEQHAKALIDALDVEIFSDWCEGRFTMREGASALAQHNFEQIVNIIRIAVAAETERCAQTADSYAQTMKLDDRERMVAAWIARDIRKPETD